MDSLKARERRDRILRAFGFKLEHRPRNGPVIWSRKGKEYLEREAWKIVNTALKEMDK